MEQHSKLSAIAQTYFPSSEENEKPAIEVASDDDGKPTFAELGLNEAILSALTTAGYTHPTPVQQRAIPAALAGRDLLVSSPTGSGKTAAFMLPAIHRFAEMQAAGELNNRAPAAHPRNQPAAPGEKPRKGQRVRRVAAQPLLLVLTPTRELAQQVSTAADTYGKQLRRLRTVSILGGMPYPRQLEMLAKQPEIIVATPGRLLDHISSGKIDLSQLMMLVLDEADRMLDMGFIDDIQAIVDATPETRQTLLFSATIDGRMGEITRRLLRDPETIEITRGSEQRTNANIEQTLHYVDDRAHKDRLLTHLLGNDSLDQAIVFTSTKRDADLLADQLEQAGFDSAALHGDMPQGVRNRTLRALRERRVRVLVATDVAARGIDVPGITHVFNYDLPKFAEDYVHRIGRTGRAGRRGVAVSLAAHAEIGAVRRIERYTRQPLPVNVVAGFEPRRSPPKAGAGGKRPGPGRGGPRHGQGNGGGRWSNSGPRHGSSGGNSGYGGGNGGSGGYQGGQRFGGNKPAGAPFERRESSGYQGGYQQAGSGNGGNGGGNGFSNGASTDRFERRSPRPFDDSRQDRGTRSFEGGGYRQDRGNRSFDGQRQDRGYGNRGNGGGFNKRRGD
ncbi:DEAD/DEAH box helicase [Pandoraea sp. ISTKB]|uniref:DEAD/DEAH box helicase n=1 Tax=Pandoraea sp. ISTKB TaxID=1586708 RepID=UPI000846FA80|nr:DEAD/DEAH box helicase [Pandoraea sp. ISTKB]ODP30814.1 RNA helicase [Pandoraea sp. ISTKB]